VDSLKTLVNMFPLPAIKPAMKETLMLVADMLLERNEPDKVQQLLASPNEVLRYLWYKHTGLLQIIAPKTIIKRHGNNNKHFRHTQDTSAATRVFSKAKLELKYSREYGRMVA
jgi:hypothetical protein